MIFALPERFKKQFELSSGKKECRYIGNGGIHLLMKTNSLRNMESDNNNVSANRYSQTASKR